MRSHGDCHRCAAPTTSGPAIVRTYTGWPKNWHNFLYALTSPNIYRFSKSFHCQNQEKIRNNAVTKDPVTPQLCCNTTLWNVKCLKSNNRKQDHFCSVTTQFKKLTSWNINRCSKFSLLIFLHVPSVVITDVISIWSVLSRCQRYFWTQSFFDAPTGAHR